MPVYCANCGEELLGAVNRCWRCGRTFAPSTGAHDVPPVRRSPPRAALATAEVVGEEVSDTAGRIRRGSPFGDSKGTRITPTSRAPDRPAIPEVPESPATTQYPAHLASAVGALLWAGSFILLGWVFGNQIEQVVEVVSTFGAGFGIFLVAALAAWIGTKYWQRQRFIRDLRVSRISPAELSAKLATGEKLVIVDLRHAYDFEADPRRIPGAIHLPVEAFDERGHEIPQGQEIILYCT